MAFPRPQAAWAAGEQTINDGNAHDIDADGIADGVIFGAAGTGTLTVTPDGTALNTDGTNAGAVTTVSGQGNINFAGASATKGDLGAPAGNILNLITINAGAVTTTGDIGATTVNFAADGSLSIANGKTVAANITNTTTNNGTLTCAQNATLTGDIGSTGAGLALISLAWAGGNAVITTDGDIKATNIRFAKNNNLHIADGHTVTTGMGAGEGIIGGAQTIGLLTFDGSATVNSNIGGEALATSLSQVYFNAGTVTLNGTVYAGFLNVDGGTLAIGRTGTSTWVRLDVENNAAIDLGPYTVTVAPASGVTGDCNIKAGSTLKTTIQSPTAAGNINASDAGGSGECTVDPASALNITVDPVFIPNGTTWTILDGKTGTGVVVVPNTITWNSAILTFAGTAANSGDDLAITATRTNTYDRVAAGNAVAAGAVLEAIGPTATGNMATVVNALDGLPSTAAIAAALQTVVPIVDSGVTTMSASMFNQFIGTATTRIESLLLPAASRDAATGVPIGCGFLKGMDIWGQSFGNYTHQDGRGASMGYNATVWGTALGGDIPVYHDNTRAGISSGFAQGFVRSKDFCGRTDINSCQGTIYGGYLNDNYPYYLDCAFSFAYNTYKGSRHIAIGAIDRIANSSYNGQQYSVLVDGGYAFDFKRFRVTPLASVQYMHLRINKYTETGADALNLNVDGQDYDVAQTGLGARFEYSWKLKCGTLVPELYAGWLYDWVGDKQATTSTFSDGAGSFATTGFDPAQSSLNAGGKLTFITKDNFFVTADYDLEVKEDFWAQAGFIELRYKI